MNRAILCFNSGNMSQPAITQTTTVPNTRNNTIPNDKQQCEDNLFLPNFCGMQMVFVVVIIAELAAIVISLAPLNTPMTERWAHLGLISLFVQWCALASCAALCLLRRYLCRMTNVQVSLFSYFVILLVITLVSEGAFWLVHHQGVHETAWHWKFLARNLLIGLIITGPILRYFYVQHQWRRNIRAESESRLQALQSRIRPHFLFNSMNTIVSLTRNQPEQAEQVVENLADLFRASLSDARQRVTLSEEFDLCQRYLEIEKLRLGDRLTVKWQTDALPQDAQLPSLLIQPLIENAIYHGIEPRTEGGTIEVEGHLADNQIQIDIRNPLQPQAGNRLAQDNIRERLLACYEKPSRLEIDESNQRYQVRLIFPYEPFNEHSDR